MKHMGNDMHDFLILKSFDITTIPERNTSLIQVFLLN